MFSHTTARFQRKKQDVLRMNMKLKGSSVWAFLAVWTDFIGKTPHFLLWFWCDVSLALTPSWTLWELLGIERLIGVFELGDLIEYSCHNISNTVYSPIMTQLGHDGHITKKMNEHFLRCEVVRIFTAEPPFATATLITENYFFFQFFQLKRLCFFFRIPPSVP